MRIVAAPLLSFLVMLTGCCSIVHMGFSQKVVVTSSPPEAAVFVDEEFRGNTPLSVSLKRHDVHEVIILKDGYVPSIVVTKKDLSFWIYGNLLIGVSAVGFLTDAIGGSMFNVKPGAIHAELIQEEAAAWTSVGKTDSPQ
jgi:hypothetical protein